MGKEQCCRSRHERKQRPSLPCQARVGHPGSIPLQARRGKSGRAIPGRGPIDVFGEGNKPSSWNYNCVTTAFAREGANDWYMVEDRLTSLLGENDRAASRRRAQPQDRGRDDRLPLPSRVQSGGTTRRNECATVNAPKGLVRSPGGGSSTHSLRMSSSSTSSQCLN